MRGAIAIIIVAGACSGGGTMATGPTGSGDPHPVDPHPQLVGAASILRGTARTQAPGFCGGAYMPNRQIPQPTPMANATLIVRAGDHNSDAAPVATVTTKADGTYEAALTAGTYCVVLPDKKDRPKAGQYTDQSCLDGYWQQCDAVAHLPSSSPIDVLRVNSCFGPCYHGPLPP